ncbi:MAG: type II secretion system protein M [Gammaproteobacteria bacterium]|nr:type II secretion system protein M [Gammaproteobacteria bacterium]
MMVEFLSRYSPREKLIVGLGLIILLGLGIHAFVIEPYQQRLTTLEEELAQSKSDLQWIKSVTAELSATGSVRPTRSFSGSLANLINQTVKQQKLDTFLAQMRPNGEDEIRVRFTEIPFNKLTGFVAQMNNQGLTVKDFKINAGDNPEQVDSNLLLEKV